MMIQIEIIVSSLYIPVEYTKCSMKWSHMYNGPNWDQCSSFIGAKGINKEFMNLR